MDIITTKVAVGLLFGVIRFLSGILPIKVCCWLKIQGGKGQKSNAAVVNERKRKRLNFAVALVQCFGGGILFATCFLHMMPEVYYSVQELREFGVLGGRYPYSQLVVSFGFFLVYFVEEICHWLISLVPKKSFKQKKRNKVSAKLATTTIGKEENNFSAQIIVAGEEEEEDIDEEEEETPAELVELIEKEARTQQEVFKCVLVVMALSFHAFFEGFAIGLQHSVLNIWYLFIPVSIHSATILFCIGLEIFLDGAKVRTIALHMLFLAITSPLGVFLGLIVSVSADMHTSAKSFAIVFLEGLSTGTILYITFFEILHKEKERRICSDVRAMAIGAGFAIMAGLECVKLSVEVQSHAALDLLDTIQTSENVSALGSLGL